MNIIEKLKQFNLEVTPEMEKAFSGDFLSEKEVDKKLNKAETERDAWKQKAETAEETLKGFEGIDPTQIHSELESWKKKATEAEERAKKQIYERDFADALKSELESVRFTSEAAKRDVMAQITAAELKLRDGKILGLSDLIAQIRKSDATAFVDEQQEKLEEGKARFTTSMNNQNGGSNFGKMTREDIDKIKDATKRQKAIAENIHLYE